MVEPPYNPLATPLQPPSRGFKPAKPERTEREKMKRTKTKNERKKRTRM